MSSGSARVPLLAAVCLALLWLFAGCSSGGAPPEATTSMKKVCGLDSELAATIRSYGDVAYIMWFKEDGVHVAPLLDYLGEWREEHWFVTTPD